MINKKTLFNNVKDKNFLRLFFVFIFVFILCSVLKPHLFLRWSNIMSMCRQFPEYGIMAIGISLTLLTGGIDLSTVYTANLASIISATFMLSVINDQTSHGLTILLILIACIISLCIGVICGMINGLLISKIGIPPILATLGTQQLFWGLAIVFSNGKTISGLPMTFFKMGNAKLFGFLPVSLIIFIALAIIVNFVLTKSKLGARLYLLGSNPTAARFAGLNCDRLIITTYGISGFLASISGLIMMASTNSAKADFGSPYTMQCILIAVMGGISPNGGVGNLKGVVLVVFILQMLSSTLNMFENVSNFYRDIIWGAALIAVMIINFVINEKASKKH